MSCSPPKQGCGHSVCEPHPSHGLSCTQLEGLCTLWTGNPPGGNRATPATEQGFEDLHLGLRCLMQP